MRPIYVNGHVLRRQPDWENRYPFLVDFQQFVPKKYLFFHDRLGYFPNEVGSKTLFEIPALTPRSETFAQLLQILMDRLLRRCLDHSKKLYLSYSGGIDSTAIACAILQSPYFSRMKAAGSLHLGMTSESIQENPTFFHDFISKFFETQVIDYGVMANPDYVFTGGEFGDQLVTSIFVQVFHDLYGPDVHARPWQDVLERYVQGLPIRKSSVELIMGFANTAPIELRSLLHWWWWFAYCCKWQELFFCGYRWFEKNMTRQEIDQQCYYPFGSPEFQQWTIGHMDQVDVPVEYRMVKKPMLDFIYQFNKDRDYYENKTKVPSQLRLNRYVYKNVIWEDFTSTNDIHTMLETP